MNHSTSISDAAALVRRAIVCSLVLCSAALAAPTTIVNNGPPSNRVDIVFLGDGYTQLSLNAGVYDQHIQSYLNYMFAGGELADPFPRYQKFFNVHKIAVVSNQSGADIPPDGIFRDTALDARYWTSGIERLLTISETKANTIRNQELNGTGITADMQLVTVNHSKYGGSGGNWAVFAGANFNAQDVALHELGHSFSNLADEYDDNGTAYPHNEPNGRNVTKNPAGQKWAHWLGYEDPRGSHLDIGVHEGGDHYATGIYRPSFSSKMRDLNVEFDAVAREAFIHDIYQRVNPLDSWRSNSQPVVDDDLWVDVIDPDVILVEWRVDGALVPEATGSTFNPADFGYVPGTYSVTARAYDEIINFANSRGILDLARTGLAALEQSITWTLTLSPLAGDYNGDNIVDVLDYNVWQASFGSDSLLDADGNEDGIVDAADYVIWRRGADEQSGGASFTAVPECATGGLAIALALSASVCWPFRGKGRSDRRRLLAGSLLLDIMACGR